MLAEPEHGPLNERVGPFGGAQLPGRGHGGELGRRGGRSSSTVASACSCRNDAGTRGLTGLRPSVRGDDPAFVFAQRDQDDLASGEDRAQAHGDRLGRHRFFAKEIAGRVVPRDGVERDQSRAAAGHAERLVEADVPVAADAQELKIDAAGPLDGAFVLAAISVDLVGRHDAVGNVDVLRLEC